MLKLIGQIVHQSPGEYIHTIAQIKFDNMIIKVNILPHPSHPKPVVGGSGGFSLKN